jgi:hypothetical protein
MGHGPRRAVVILWLWTVLLSAVVLLPTFTDRGNTLVAPAVIALGLLLYIYFHPGVRTARQGEPEGGVGVGAGGEAGHEELDAPADDATSDSVVELDRHRHRRASG